jgi:hypothetical protein
VCMREGGDEDDDDDDDWGRRFLVWWRKKNVSRRARGSNSSSNFDRQCSSNLWSVKRNWGECQDLHDISAPFLSLSTRWEDAQSCPVVAGTAMGSYTARRLCWCRRVDERRTAADTRRPHCTGERCRTLGARAFDEFALGMLGQRVELQNSRGQEGDGTRRIEGRGTGD